MFMRTTWLDVPTSELEARIAEYPGRMKSIREAPGCASVALLANRETGATVSVTYWDTKESMLATDAVSEQIRAQVVAESGVQINDVDRFEFLIQDRVAPPVSGTFLRVTDFVAPLTKVDAISDLLRGNLALARSLSGFRALLLFANRETGRMLIAAAWNTAADREASVPAIQPIRDQIAALRGDASVKVDLYELVYADVKAPAPA